MAASLADGVLQRSRALAPALLGSILAYSTVLVAPGPAAALDWGSLWPFGSKGREAPIPDPVPYQAELALTGGDRSLEKTLKRASALLSRQKTPPSGVVGLLARARQDVSALTAVLYENARYAAEIEILVAGRPLDRVDPFAPIASRPVPVTIRVRAGQVFVFGSIDVGLLPPGTTAEDLGLVAGRPAGSGEIVAAETLLVAKWGELGHPLAATLPREIVADHRTGRLDIRLRVGPGPVASFGRVTVSGTRDVDANLVLRRSGIAGAGRFTPKTEKRAETRLRELGVFDSVRIIRGDRLDPDGTIPVTIEVSERKPRVIGASVNYSSTEGAGIEAYWMHRNLFGGAEQLRLSAAVSRLIDAALIDPDFRLAARFVKPAVITPMTDFTLRAEGYREATDSYRVTSALAETGLSHAFSDTLAGSAMLSIERSQTIEKLMTEDHLILTLTGTMTLDTRDDKLDPGKGMRAMLAVAPAYDFSQSRPFARIRGEVATYRALDRDERFVLAGRIAAGVLITDDAANVAADRRFYAGGGGSVRGYAYKNLGPRNGMGDLVGGRSLLEGTVELRYRVNETFGVAAFVDAGNAYSSLIPNPGDLKFGAGVGLRYITPVGPLRLDVALPLNPGPGDPAFGVYVGLGQSF